MFTYANKKLPVIIVVSVPFFSLLSLLLDVVVKRVSSGLLLWALLFRIFTIFTYVTHKLLEAECEKLFGLNYGKR